MTLGKLVLGIASVGTATLGCAMYGVTDAKGVPLPAKEYVLPAAAVAPIYVGTGIPLPDNEPSLQGGMLMAGVVTAMGVFSYGIGYAIGHLTN